MSKTSSPELPSTAPDVAAELARVWAHAEPGTPGLEELRRATAPR